MSISAGETEALICAFRLRAVTPLGMEALGAEPTEDDPVWLHFNLFDNRARRYLEHASIDEDGRALLLGAEGRIKAIGFEGGFAALFGDLHHDFDGDPDSFGTLRVYVDARRIITCRKQRVRSLDRVRRELQRGSSGKTPMLLFDQVLEQIAAGFADAAEELGDTVETAEDRVLAGRADDESRELGRVRRVIARLRRYTSADRIALSQLAHRVGSLCDEEQRARLHDVIERFDATGQDLELVSERARLLQEEIASRLGEATNKNLYLLSIVTTALLPITLVTGVFGMNVGGLPFVASEHGFWWVMFGMLLVVLGTLFLLRRRRVF